MTAAAITDLRKLADMARERGYHDIADLIDVMIDHYVYLAAD